MANYSLKYCLPPLQPGFRNHDDNNIFQNTAALFALLTQYTERSMCETSEREQDDDRRCFTDGTEC